MLGLGHTTGPGWAPLGQRAVNTSCPGSVLLPRAGGQHQLCQSLSAVTWPGHSQPLPRRQERAQGRGSSGSTGPESPAPGWCRHSCCGPFWWPEASESGLGDPAGWPALSLVPAGVLIPGAAPVPEPPPASPGTSQGAVTPLPALRIQPTVWLPLPAWSPPSGNAALFSTTVSLKTWPGNGRPLVGPPCAAHTVSVSQTGEGAVSSHMKP